MTEFLLLQRRNNNIFYYSINHKCGSGIAFETFYGSFSCQNNAYRMDDKSPYDDLTDGRTREYFVILFRCVHPLFRAITVTCNRYFYQLVIHLFCSISLRFHFQVSIFRSLYYIQQENMLQLETLIKRKMFIRKSMIHPHSHSRYFNYDFCMTL